MTVSLWWTCVCALVATAGARVLERCELAHELQRLGVQQDHIATWVCIAYHESRLDTNAYNPYSGDHGLLQISELYWCGPGKECGVPCSAFHDDDIADDINCALQIHEEHTRLQGDGFLAWVVYLQHCKHNTKKYLAECDDYKSKNFTYETNQVHSAISTYSYNTNYIFPYLTRVDDLRPPVSFRNEYRNPYYAKHLKFGGGEYNKVDLKGLSIDDLKLPVFKKPEVVKPASVSTTTTTTTMRPVTTTPQVVTTTPRIVTTTPRIVTTTPHRTTTSRQPASTTPVSPSTTTKTDADSKIGRNPFRFRLIKPPKTTSTPSNNTLSTTTQSSIKTTIPSVSITTSAPYKYATGSRRRFDVYVPKTSTTEVSHPTPGRYTFTTKTLSSFTTQSPITRETSTAYITNRPPILMAFTTRSSVSNASTSLLSVTPSTAKNAVTPSTKPTQSIFDLYLNPTKPPTFSNIPNNSNSPYRIRIFYDGTTQAPWTSRKAPKGGNARNHFRRETQEQESN